MDYTKLDDEKLVLLAQSKDADAMEVLILRYRQMVSSVARSYFLTDGDVEDLIQVGQIGVFKAITTYNGKVDFKYYVFKCIKNAVLTAIKKSQTDKNKALSNYVSLSGFVDGDNDKNPLLIDAQFDPEETLINTETEQELKDKFAQYLSKYEYEILTYYLQGYTYNEISEKLNKKSKSIDNALQRIKNKLLDKIKHVG